MRMKVLLILFLVLTASVGHAQIKIANDPSNIGIGARALGMGGVTLNFSDIASIFGNPASLSKIKSPQYTMMSGKFINEVDYLSFAGAFPTVFGVVGVGYAGSQLTLTGPVPTIEVVDSIIIIIPSTTEVRTDSYGTSTLQFSLSKPAKDFIRFGLFEKMLLGGTLKIFSQNLSATGLTGQASGYEVDLGMRIPVNPRTEISIVGKNLLPAASGGKLVWKTSGREETFPYYLRMGLQVGVDYGVEIINIQPQTLIFAFEYDYHPRGNAPDLLHYGLEWGLGEMLYLRAGRDQGYIGRGGTTTFDIANNLTYGVGVKFRGWRFDYAFHEYYGIAENNTHYISLSYGFPYVELKKRAKKLSVEPADKLITTKTGLALSGKILDEKIVGITVNSKPIQVTDDLFSSKMKLALKKNNFLINGLDIKGRLVTSEARRILRLVGFDDVGPTHKAKRPIEILATLGIIRGYPGDLFKPENGVSRAEFATLLARLVGQSEYQAKGELPFSDIEPNHWAYRSVAYALDNNLIKGYPDGTFRPNKRISRAEGVVIIARFDKLNLKAPINEIPYKDIPGRHWAIKEISAAKLAGYLKHLAGNFYPNTELSRAETAIMLAKVKYVKSKIDDLLDFNKGYK